MFNIKSWSSLDKGLYVHLSDREMFIEKNKIIRSKTIRVFDLNNIVGIHSWPRVVSLRYWYSIQRIPDINSFLMRVMFEISYTLVVTPC